MSDNRGRYCCWRLCNRGGNNRCWRIDNNRCSDLSRCWCCNRRSNRGRCLRNNWRNHGCGCWRFSRNWRGNRRFNHRWGCSQGREAHLGRRADACGVYRPLGIDGFPADLGARAFLPKDKGQLAEQAVQGFLIIPNGTLHGDGDFRLAPVGRVPFYQHVDLFRLGVR